MEEVLDTLALTVFREDTDVLGIVFYRHLLAWFERGRENVISTAFLADMYATTGESFVVTRSEQTFKNPAVFGDRLEIRTRPYQDGAFRLAFEQSIWKVGEDYCVVKGFVEMATVSRQFKLCPVPKPVLELIAPYGRPKKSHAARKLPPPRTFASKEATPKGREFTYDFSIHQADTDFTGVGFHPNFYCWMEKARTEALTPVLLARVAAEYGAVPVMRSAKLEFKLGVRPYEPLRILTKPCASILAPLASPGKHFVVALEQDLFRVSEEKTTDRLATGKFEVVFINQASRQVVPVPECVIHQLLERCFNK